MVVDRHEDRCPTCGRFVPASGEGYYDLPPGGRQSHDYLVVYCDEGCAGRKDPPARYEEEEQVKGIGEFDDGRVADLGRAAARRDHSRRRPVDEETSRWWAPSYRTAYEAERRRLGTCEPDEHDWQPSRVRGETPAVIRQLRALGAQIEVCARCGVFRDRLQ